MEVTYISEMNTRTWRTGYALHDTRPRSPKQQAEGSGESQLSILVREGRYGRDEPSLGLRHSIDTATMQVRVDHVFWLNGDQTICGALELSSAHGDVFYRRFYELSIR